MEQTSKQVAPQVLAQQAPKFRQISLKAPVNGDSSPTSTTLYVKNLIPPPKHFESQAEMIEPRRSHVVCRPLKKRSSDGMILRLPHGFS
jgi:hypothetical protein